MAKTATTPRQYGATPSGKANTREFVADLVAGWQRRILRDVVCDTRDEPHKQRRLGKRELRQALNSLEELTLQAFSSMFVCSADMATRFRAPVLCEDKQSLGTPRPAEPVGDDGVAIRTRSKKWRDLHRHCFRYNESSPGASGVDFCRDWPTALDKKVNRAMLSRHGYRVVLMWQKSARSSPGDGATLLNKSLCDAARAWFARYVLAGNPTGRTLDLRAVRALIKWPVASLNQRATKDHSWADRIWLVPDSREPLLGVRKADEPIKGLPALHRDVAILLHTFFLCRRVAHIYTPDIWLFVGAGQAAVVTKDKLLNKKPNWKNSRSG